MIATSIALFCQGSRGVPGIKYAAMVAVVAAFT
jgi:hypothetical protein